jgi:hypothetical protein
MQSTLGVKWSFHRSYIKTNDKCRADTKRDIFIWMAYTKMSTFIVAISELWKIAMYFARASSLRQPNFQKLDRKFQPKAADDTTNIYLGLGPSSCNGPRGRTRP